MYSTKPLTPPANAKFSSLPVRSSISSILHAVVQERQLAQALGQDVVVEVDVAEDLASGRKCTSVPRRSRRRRSTSSGATGDAVAEFHLVHLAVAPDREPQPFGQRVDHRHADAVQAAGDLVAVLVELAAGVQLGHDDLGGRALAARRRP